MTFTIYIDAAVQLHPQSKFLAMPLTVLHGKHFKNSVKDYYSSLVKLTPSQHPLKYLLKST